MKRMHRRTILGLSGSAVGLAGAAAAADAEESSTDAAESAIPSRRVIGDLGVDVVETVTYDDRACVVTRYRNLADRGSGIDVFVDGDLLTDEDIVDPYLVDAAWVHALGDIRDGEALEDGVRNALEELRRVGQNTADRLEQAEQTLETAVDDLDALRSRELSIDGETIAVWDAAIDRIPALAELDGAARTLRDRTAEHGTIAQEVETATGPFLADLPAPGSAPDEADQDRLRDAETAVTSIRQRAINSVSKTRSAADAARATIETLAADGTTAELVAELESRAGGANADEEVREEVAAFLDEASAVAETVQDAAERPIDVLETLAATAADVTDRVSVVAAADTHQESFREAWEARRTGEPLVVTGATASAFGLAVAFILAWAAEVDRSAIGDGNGDENRNGTADGGSA